MTEEREYLIVYRRQQRVNEHLSDSFHLLASANRAYQQFMRLVLRHAAAVRILIGTLERVRTQDLVPETTDNCALRYIYLLTCIRASVFHLQLGCDIIDM